MQHIVLLGDSIFDNAPYVNQGESVIEQLSAQLAAGEKATLLAVDGDVTADVHEQLQRLPADATRLFLSVGGNDALLSQSLLMESCKTVGEALTRFALVQRQFQENYRRMLDAVLTYQLPLTICTIYDRIPDLTLPETVGLSIFNESILRLAAEYRLDLLDLRLLCEEEADYSDVSPIEPSAQGANKISGEILKRARATQPA